MADDDKTFTEKNRHKKSGIVVEGVGDVGVRFSQCCSPVPGDEIVGFVTRGRGVSLHRTDCINMVNLDEDGRNRLIEAEWRLSEKTSENLSYLALIRIIAFDNINMFTDISRAFSEEKIPVKSLNCRTTNDTAIFDVGIMITGKQQLDKLKFKLFKIDGVQEIERVTT